MKPLKSPLVRGGFPIQLKLNLLETSASADGGSLQSHRSGLSSSQVEGEVVSVALVHDFHAEVGAVQHISPGVQDAALTIKDGLVEVETVQVEGHG